MSDNAMHRHTWLASKFGMPTERVVYGVALVVFTIFVGSTLPGLRPEPGYNLLLDGFLNNIAYELCAVLCFIRARKDPSFRASWKFLGIGLALYGLGNIYWTLLCPNARSRTLAIAGGCSMALLLSVRLRRAAARCPRYIRRLPPSLWLDGVVGGLAVGAIAATFFGPILAITGGSSAATIITTLAYPLLDVLLLLVTTAVLALFHWRPPFGLWCMAAGLILFSIADAIYLFAAGNGTYVSGGINRRCLGARHTRHWIRARLAAKTGGREASRLGIARHPSHCHPRRSRPARLRPRPQAASRCALPGCGNRRLCPRPSDRYLTARRTRWPTAASSR